MKMLPARRAALFTNILVNIWYPLQRKRIGRYINDDNKRKGPNCARNPPNDKNLARKKTRKQSFTISQSAPLRENGGFNSMPFRAQATCEWQLSAIRLCTLLL